MRPRLPLPRLPKDLPALLRPRLRHGRDDLQQRVFPGNRELPQSKPSYQEIPRGVRPADGGA